MADLTSIVGAAAAGVNPVTAIVGLGKDLIDRFIPDPALKAAAASHLADVQLQLAEAQIDATTKQAEATTQQLQAAAPANNDHYMGAVRGTFGFVMIALYAWNYGIGPAVHQVTVQIPMNITVMFAVLLLGFVGVPAGIEMAKQIASMPGDSTVSLLGLSVGNKSKG